MQLHKLVKKYGLDALYLTKSANVRYHTNFTGSFGICIVKTDKTILITDPRYQEQAKRLCPANVQVVITDKSTSTTIVNVLTQEKIKSIGFEADYLSYNQALELRRTLKPITVKPLNQGIDQIRMIKKADELKLIQKSQQLNEQILQQIINDHLAIGVTEQEIAWQIEKIARDLGCPKLAFPPIVAFGSNSASPHHSPTLTKLQQGDVILIDMGVTYKGYCSDMSRTFFTKPPTKEQTTVYETVLAAQLNAINNLKPSITGKQGDQLSRHIITQAGYGDFFGHANGHGLGLEIHEAPSLSSKTKHKDRNIVLQPGMTITVEPGIYLPGKFGVRIEDIVALTKNGNQNLTNFPKNIAEITITL